MDKLEELLSLLQTYGVTEYSDQELKLTLTHIPEVSEEVYEDEEEFRVMIESMEVTPPKPTN